MRRLVLLVALLISACGTVIIDPQTQTALVPVSPLRVEFVSPAATPTSTPVPAAYWERRGKIQACMDAGWVGCQEQGQIVDAAPDWDAYWLGWWNGCIGLAWPGERLGDLTENERCGRDMAFYMQWGVR